jgi:cytolysin (calcineurin-like family phosphatase)
MQREKAAKFGRKQFAVRYIYRFRSLANRGSDGLNNKLMTQYALTGANSVQNRRFGSFDRASDKQGSAEGPIKRTTDYVSLHE